MLFSKADSPYLTDNSNVQSLSVDRRSGPLSRPANKLTAKERKQVLAIANAPKYRDLPPKQIVPRLADEGIYVASESTFYRILRAEHQLAHRERCRPATHKRPLEKEATGPCQVWSRFSLRFITHACQQQRQQHRLSPEDLDFSAMRMAKVQARMLMLI